MLAIPTHQLAKDIALGTRQKGGRALLIGGCVRDQYFGKVSKDCDMELFGVPEAEVEALLRKTAANVIRVGRSFPVWKAWGTGMGTDEAIDVALPRREVKTGPHHVDFSVVLDPGMSVEEAARRRDFTINTISLDPLTGEVLDFHRGVADIRTRTLRHTSDAHFGEDPLRVLRGMQFCGRFNLTAAPETIALCQGLTADGISSERIMEEWKKLILKAEVPSKGLAFLHATGWTARFFPELAALKGVPQDPIWHPEGDALTHTHHCLDAFARRRTGNDDVDLRVGLSVLTHDFGKASRTMLISGRWRSHGHEAAGQVPAEAFLRRMTDQTELIQGVKALVAHHMVPHDLHRSVEKNGVPESADAALRRLAVRLGGEHTSIGELALVCRCDHAGRPPLPERNEAAEWLAERADKVQVLHERPRPLLQGRDLIALGMTPGIEFKAILEDAFTRQLSGEIQTREEAVDLARTHLGQTEGRAAARMDEPPVERPVAPPVRTMRPLPKPSAGSEWNAGGFSR